MKRIFTLVVVIPMFSSSPLRPPTPFSDQS